MMITTGWTLVLVLISGAAKAVVGEPERSLEGALEAIQRHSFNEALEFAPRTDGHRKEAADPIAFTRALAILNKQPKTQGNTERAARLFKKLHQAAPGSEIGIASLYFLGRIQQIHRHPFNQEEALRTYRLLSNQYKEHFFGQLAAHRIAMIQLYHPSLKLSERQELFLELESLGEAMPNRHIRSSFHFLMGRASLRLDLPAEVSLEHYLKCARLGIVADKFRGNVFLSTANLAQELGRKELAREYYAKFLGEFERDKRATLVKDRLAELSEED